MKIPGSNLLNKAFKLINPQTVTYYVANGRTVNDIGQYVTTYAEGVEIITSFQPIPTEYYQQNGLDFDRIYYSLWAPQNIIGIDRDVSNDRVEFNGQLFDCVSSTMWVGIDGWVEVRCVRQ